MVSNRPSDEILAKMAKEGDTRAFEEIFERYKRPILNLIYRLIGNKETAEEVTQEVFMKVYNNLDIYDPKRDFKPWIYTITRNLAKNALRDRKYFHDITLDRTISQDKNIRLRDVISDPKAAPDLIAQDEELNEQAQAVLNAMPIKYREVITLCSVEGLTYEEAAKILGCSIATVGIRLKKAKILFMRSLGIERKSRKE